MHRGQACSHRINSVKHFFLEGHPCCLKWMYLRDVIQSIYVQVEADIIYIYTFI